MQHKEFIFSFPDLSPIGAHGLPGNSEAASGRKLCRRCGWLAAQGACWPPSASRASILPLEPRPRPSGMLGTHLGSPAPLRRCSPSSPPRPGSHPKRVPCCSLLCPGSPPPPPPSGSPPTPSPSHPHLAPWTPQEAMPPGLSPTGSAPQVPRRHPQIALMSDPLHGPHLDRWGYQTASLSEPAVGAGLHTTWPLVPPTHHQLQPRLLRALSYLPHHPPLSSPSPPPSLTH